MRKNTHNPNHGTIGRRLTRGIAAGLIASCFAAASFADFDDLGAGARAEAMGNAFVALADDAFGIYYNPAGLGFIRTSQIGADFGKLYFGLDDNSLLISGFTGAAFPILKAQVIEVPLPSTPAVGVSSDTAAVPTASTATVRVTTYRHRGTIGVGARYFSLMEYYQEYAYYLSYGRPVGDRWAWGVNLKYLQEKYLMNAYTEASPVFDYGKKDAVSAVSADLGAIYNIAPRFFAGASLANINQPNLGLAAEDALPFTGRVGIAWKDRDVAWALDGIYRDQRWYYATGFEKYIRDLFGVRAGICYGGKNYLSITGGLSFTFYRAQIDYVFQYPLTGIRDISGTHRMSFVFRFGKKKKDELTIGTLEYYYDKAQDEVASLKEQLTQVTSEKENLEKILVEEATLRIQERIKAAKNEPKAVPAAIRETGSVTREISQRRHTVVAGETLQLIADKYFGDTRLWNEIYLVNKERVGRGGKLKPGQVLTIPVVARSEAAKPETTAEVAPVKTAAPAAPPEAEKKNDAAPATVVPAPAVGTPAEPVKVEPAPETKTAAAILETPKPAPAAVKPAPVPKEKEKPKAPRRHTVQSGENLRSISEKYYGTPNRWKDIYTVNKDKVISGQVAPGQEITIP